VNHNWQAFYHIRYEFAYILPQTELTGCLRSRRDPYRLVKLNSKSLCDRLITVSPSVVWWPDCIVSMAKISFR